MGRFLRKAAWFFVSFSFVLACTAVGIFLGLLTSYVLNMPDIRILASYTPKEMTQIFDRNGELLATLYREKRIYTPLEEVSPHLIKAVIASEDTSFFKHIGIDVKGLLRAIVVTVLSGGKTVQGGSTITQQLARNIMLSRERSIERKIAEMFLAIQIERAYSKEEILELYLNQIYFGHGAYGVEAAAQTYFGKHAKDLTLAESAMLVGLIPAPEIFSPFVNYGKAKLRQRLVLERMEKLGMITEEEKEKALAERLVLRPKRLSWKAPYFVDMVIRELISRFGARKVYEGGLKVYTTLDLRIQRAAEESLKRWLERAKRDGKKIEQGAVVALDPNSGEVLALVGGTDYSESQFNRAVQSKRQPGSAFKPFVYLTAILKGWRLCDFIDDSPLEIELPDGSVWTPRNYDGRFRGKVTLRGALVKSINVPTVRLLLEVGIQNVIDTARKAGITSKLEKVPSLALGACGVSLLELCRAYATFANGGFRIKPTIIRFVKDGHGAVILRAEVEKERVFPYSAVYLLNTVLRDVVEKGTGRAARLHFPVAGKTGTASGFRDAWFIGFSPDIVIGVWVGNDDFSPMDHVVGGSYPARIWRDIAEVALSGRPARWYPMPPDVVVAKVPWLGTTEFFVRGTEPKGAEMLAASGATREAEPSSPEVERVAEVSSPPPKAGGSPEALTEEASEEGQKEGPLLQDVEIGIERIKRYIEELMRLSSPEALNP